jgi:hypothetical protein
MTWAVIPMPSLLGTLVFERTAGETFRAPGGPVRVTSRGGWDGAIARDPWRSV